MYNLFSINHDFTMQKLLCRTIVYENDFFSLEEFTQFSSYSKSVASFKNNLKRFDLSADLKYVLADFTCCIISVGISEMTFFNGFF